MKHYTLKIKQRRFGLLQACNAIQKYAPQYVELYDSKKILEILNKFDEKEKSDMTQGGQTSNREEQLDNICTEYVKDHAEEILSKYPILRLAFNPDGTKKELRTLLQEKEKLQESGENIDTIEELYRNIINNAEPKKQSATEKCNDEENQDFTR